MPIPLTSSASSHAGSVPLTASVTTCRPGRWETPLGIFDFRHIQTSFFDGYQLVNLGRKQQAFIARPEKALLDLVYREPGADPPAYLAELRLENLDWQVLERLANRTGKPKLERAIHVLHALAGAKGQFESL